MCSCVAARGSYALISWQNVARRRGVPRAAARHSPRRHALHIHGELRDDHGAHRTGDRQYALARQVGATWTTTFDLAAVDLLRRTPGDHESTLLGLPCAAFL